MSTDFRQLANLEQLSETMLIEILKNRCIELPDVKTLKKVDLIEMFKRIAIPMPQRQYNEAKYLGKKLHDLRVARNISVSTKEDKELYDSIISSQNLTKSHGTCVKSSSEVAASKKIQHSNSSTGNNGLVENSLKRKMSEDKASTEFKKRHKITWP